MTRNRSCAAYQCALHSGTELGWVVMHARAKRQGAMHHRLWNVSLVQVTRWCIKCNSGHTSEVCGSLVLEDCCLEKSIEHHTFGSPSVACHLAVFHRVGGING